MHLVFWQNILSPHQAPFMRALVNDGHDVTIVTAESMTPDRLALGWVAPDMGQARVVVAPRDGEVLDLIEGSDRAAIHVIAGARWKRLGNLAAGHCLRTGRRLGIITESPDPRGLAGYGRWAKYTFERLTHGFHFDFVLAMGEMGSRWFRHCGYPPRSLFPFAYVTESAPAPHQTEQAGGFSILYCGQFIPRKGLDVLLRAFAGIPSTQVRLCLLGNGPELARLQRDAQSLGIQKRIVWLEQRNSREVQMEMEKADITVLPSRHDGWGAVVNESLMVGTSVICSTACGAAELIRQPWLGAVFPSGSVEELTRVLKAWIDLGPRSQAERERIRQWSNCISGEAVAKYFTAVMDQIYSHSPRPVAPWRR